MSYKIISCIWFTNLVLFAACEEDINFDSFKHQPLQRLWGVPDVTAQIGRLFHYGIPSNAFYGNVARFKAYREDGAPLPSWLIFHEKSGLLEGVPSEEDLGEHYITVKAFDDHLRDFVKDIFALEVLSKADIPPQDTTECRQEADSIMVSVILDFEYRKLPPRQRISLIKLFSKYFKISTDILSLGSVEANDKLLNQDVINAGPGDVKEIKFDSSTSITFKVGCRGSLLKKYGPVLDEMAKASQNGTLSSILTISVIGWKIWKEAPGYEREKREVHYLLSSEGNDETVTPEPRSVVRNPATPRYSLSSASAPSSPVESPPPPSTSRHHRHYHGLSRPHLQPTSPLLSLSMPTPTYIPDRPSSYTPDYEFERNVSPTISFMSNTTTNYSMEMDTLNEIKGTGDLLEAYVSSAPTPPLNTSSPEESTPYAPLNAPPIIGQLLQKFSVPAGKVLRFKIPENTFMDAEDGNTRNLRLKLKLNSTTEIPPDFWIQLDEETQEIYALPLENAISKWNFELYAYDSGGLFVQDVINIYVQDNKARRAVNHAITLDLLAIPPGISLDWELLLLDTISEKFGDSDTSNITVLNVTTREPYALTWTNDSLPRHSCPLTEINHLYQILANDKDGLKYTEVHSGLKIGNISWTGIGICESKPPELQNENFPPLVRNPVDYINATVGQLLIFSVPEDAFYDPEDGSARSLKLSLETKDGEQVPYNNWLQFDVKNQEFYGIPMSHDVGSKEYQLICRDKGGLLALDVLLVVVHPAPRIMYNVEFSVKLNLDYSKFVESPAVQRSFVEKLARLFEDPNTNAIVLSGISPGSTVITWHNKTLPTNTCPDNKIKQLRQVILGDDERVTEAVSEVMGDEFPVLSARLTPTGLCQGALTDITSTGVQVPSSGDVTAVSNPEHYIIGLIVPLIVIIVMLFCAGIVACVLYRRRRTGKMSVGDEDERQTFRSKGIPVIFQDELDERPEPTNKSPVIMKEEKPPLPPPEYQRGPALATTALLSDTEDSPYQPPPPFTTTRDSARPKPTPTYRMPPPYVPP